eukprot:scaffold106034_cov30-Tisochrysis_lutea.AAC.2
MSIAICRDWSSIWFSSVGAEPSSEVSEDRRTEAESNGCLQIDEVTRSECKLDPIGPGRHQSRSCKPTPVLAWEMRVDLAGGSSARVQ